jgi:hypothetical protein
MNQLAFLEGNPDQVPVCVVEQRTVQNKLRLIFDELRGSPAWPWEQKTLDLYREQTLPDLYDLLDDEVEASIWRGRIEREMTRLDAMSLPF